MDSYFLIQIPKFLPVNYSIVIIDTIDILCLLLFKFLHKKQSIKYQSYLKSRKLILGQEICFCDIPKFYKIGAIEFLAIDSNSAKLLCIQWLARQSISLAVF